jgi:energy-coupling factor transport system ATP-binding protein
LRPGLLLLDEPTANLDPAGARLVREAIRRVLDDSGATLVIVEHRVAEVLHLVDRVVVLEPGGGVAAEGAPGQVFAERGASLRERGVWLPGPAEPRPRRSKSIGAPVMRGERLTLRYPSAAQPVVRDRDVELCAGEILALTGPNGSGKSTLALLLAGLIRPDAGAALLTDSARPLHTRRANELVRRVGSVFQDPEHQFLRSRVEDELLVGPMRAGASEVAARRTAAELLERLHLTHLADANPFTLSGGEKRRLSVATALATAPDVLVLDEPTFGQDARTWAELVSLCSGLRDQGKAILAVTHDTTFVDALADRRLELTP